MRCDTVNEVKYYDTVVRCMSICLRFAMTGTYSLCYVVKNRVNVIVHLSSGIANV